MRVELPELRRCCFCLPLRYGLIAWGYFKLIPLLLLFSMATATLVTTVKYSATSMHNVYIEEFMLTSIFLLIVVLDISLTIAFIVGAHRKSAKLLHIYCIYNMVIMCLFTLFFTWSIAYELYFMARFANEMSYGFASIVSIIQMRLLVGIFFLGIQVYIILLTRSEVNKLRNCSKYRFSNPTVEAATLENGTSEHEINPKESNEVGTDSQFEGIIDQTKKAGRENFNYNKF